MGIRLTSVNKSKIYTYIVINIAKLKSRCSFSFGARSWTNQNFDFIFDILASKLSSWNNLGYLLVVDRSAFSVVSFGDELGELNDIWAFDINVNPLRSSRLSSRLWSRLIPGPSSNKGTSKQKYASNSNGLHFLFVGFGWVLLIFKLETKSKRVKKWYTWALVRLSLLYPIRNQLERSWVPNWLSKCDGGL